MQKLQKIQFLVMVALLATLILNSCKKSGDDSSPASSSDGSVTLKGTKMALPKCYSMKNPGNSQEIMLLFVSSGITITGVDSNGFKPGTSGTGNMFWFIIHVPAGQTLPASGNYTIESEPEFRVPFNYDGALYKGVDLSTPANTWVELGLNKNLVLSVIKSGNAYEFAANGLMEDSTAVQFMYKGSISSLNASK